MTITPTTPISVPDLNTSLPKVQKPASTTPSLFLGPVEFKSFEVPEELPFGGNQQLSIKKFIGGRRIIDAMGRDDEAIDWQGTFIGADAFDRAATLDQMRIAGVAVDLYYAGLSYIVVISHFRAKIRAGHIPYTITVEIIEDRRQTNSSDSQPSVDTVMANDAASATAIADGIGSSSLSSGLASFTDALSTVSSLVTAGRSDISQLQSLLRGPNANVLSLINAGEAVVGSVSTLGGVLPFAPAASALALDGQAANMSQLADLHVLASTLGRMNTNLAMLNVSGTELQVGGANLFNVAVQAYGDMTGWSTIARSNGLTDPLVSGITTLVIPPAQYDDGGVLSQ